MSRSVYAGLSWTFTPLAMQILLEAVAQGLEYDLAVTILHSEVENGKYRENEIYCLPEEDIIQ